MNPTGELNWHFINNPNLPNSQDNTEFPKLPIEVLSRILLEAEDIRSLIAPPLGKNWSFSRIVQHHIGSKDPHVIHKIVRCLNLIITKSDIPLERMIDIQTLSTAQFTKEDFEQLLDESIDNQQFNTTKALLANPTLRSYNPEELSKLFIKCIGYSLENLALWMLDHTPIDPTYNHNQPIETACKIGLKQVFEALTQKNEVGSTVDYSYLLSLCIEYNHPEIFQKLLQTQHVNAYITQDLFLTLIQQNRTEMVKILLKTNLINPAFNDQASFKTACQLGNVQLVRALLALNKRPPGIINPAAEDNYAIQVASYFGHYEVVQILLALRRVNPTANQNAALRFAIKQANVPLIKLLLSDERVQTLALQQRIDIEQYLDG